MKYYLFEVNDDNVYIFLQSSTSLDFVNNYCYLMQKRYPLSNFIIFKKIEFVSFN